MSLTLLIVGLGLLLGVLWLVVTYMPAPWKTPFIALIVILILLFIVQTIFPNASLVRR